MKSILFVAPLALFGLTLVAQDVRPAVYRPDSQSSQVQITKAADSVHHRRHRRRRHHKTVVVVRH
jgi:hypothetical protein